MATSIAKHMNGNIPFLNIYTPTRSVNFDEIQH